MENYQLILVDSKDPSMQGREALKQQLGTKLHLSQESLDSMFSQLPVIIKKGVPEDKAKLFRQALENIGAEIEVRKEGVTAPEKSSEGNSLDLSASHAANNAKEKQDIAHTSTFTFETGSNSEKIEDSQLHTSSEPQSSFSTDSSYSQQDSAHESFEHEAEEGDDRLTREQEVEELLRAAKLKNQRKSQVSNFVKIGFAFIILLAGVYYFDPLSFLQPSKTEPTKIDSAQIRALLSKQPKILQDKAIVASKKDGSGKASPALPDKVLVFTQDVLAPATAPDGDIETSITVRHDGNDLKSLSFSIKQNPPPPITNEQLVSGFRHRPFLRKFAMENYKPGVANDATGNPTDSPGQFSVKQKAYVYVEDALGTGRVAATLAIQGSYHKDQDTMHVLWKLYTDNLDDKPSLVNFAKRIDGDKFQLFYQGHFLAKLTSEKASNKAYPGTTAPSL